MTIQLFAVFKNLKIMGLSHKYFKKTKLDVLKTTS